MVIRKELGLLLSGEYSELDLNIVVEFFKRYAVSYIRMKRKAENSFFRNEDINSVAYNSISELFSRNDENRFPNLERYFSDIQIDKLKDHELEPEIRRLVFTKVNDYLYRRIGELDPSLKKIIRNIKLTIKSGRFNDKLMVSANHIKLNSETNTANLPELPPEFLEIYLCSMVKQSSQIPDIIAEAIEIIDRQQFYKKGVTITTLALSVRKAFTVLQQNREQEENSTMRTILNGDLERFIGISKKQVQERITAKYSKNGKMEPQVVEKYFSAAADILKDQFVDNKQFENSQFEYLSSYLENVDYDSFRDIHRQRLEYFVRLMRDEMIDMFKKDLFQNQQTG